MRSNDQAKRPTGITLLSLVLAWLAIAGALNAWFIFTGDSPDLGPVFGAAALGYAVTALTASIGMWQMTSWALHALHAWMFVCLLMLAGLAYVFDDFIKGGIPGLVGFSIFIGLFFLGIHRYVQTKFAAGDGGSGSDEQ